MVYDSDSENPVFSIKTRVAGAYYYYFNKIGYKKVEDWTFVRLEPEPTNPYDKFAVKVLLTGELMGYVPKGLSSIIFNILKNKDFRLEAYIKLGDNEKGEHKRSDWEFILVIMAYTY